MTTAIFKLGIIVCSNMPFSKAISSHGFHVYNFTTWQKVEDGHKVYFALETRKEALNIDPYSIAVQIFPRDQVAPVTYCWPHSNGNIRICVFMKRAGELSSSVLSKTYKPSPIPEGGLKIPLKITFQQSDESILDKMKDFVTEN